MPEKEKFRWGRKSRAEGAEPTTSEELVALQAQIADKQNELAQLQAKAAEIEQQHRDSRDERWGVNDITVPNEGEMTYQEYLEQRPLSDEEKAYAEHLEQNPAEGRTKAGYEQYREENNLSAIDDSQNSAEEHYASIGELENKGEYQQPELENMNLVQLSREAAKAITLGDRAREEDVREAVKKYLESSYDADSSDAGRERHMKEDYDKFWERVGKLTSEPKEQEKSRWEKIKAGFKFERDMLRKNGAMAYFSEKWDRVMRGLKDHTLDHGITEEMSDEEKEKKRKHNRVVLIAGGAAVAALGVVAAMHGFDHSSAAPGTEAFQSGHVGVTGTEAHASGIDVGNFNDILGGNKGHTEVAGVGLGDFSGSEAHVGAGTESTLAYPPLSEKSASVSVDALSSTYENVKDIYNISKGMGGIELFDRLGIGGDKWVQNAQTLLSRFPNDFNVVDGDVRIAHSGWLSQDAQNYIESLR